MKREIELKARSSDLSKVITYLTSKKCLLSQPLSQVDEIYLRHGITPQTKKLSDPVLRIRKEGSTNIFTYKHSNSQDLDKTELETAIEDPDSLNQIILHLGFYLFITVKKKRIMTTYKGFTVCLDEIEGLGEFVELEKIADEDAIKVQEEMKKIFKELGIGESDLVFQSYDIMLAKSNQ